MFLVRNLSFSLCKFSALYEKDGGYCVLCDDLCHGLRLTFPNVYVESLNPSSVAADEVMKAEPPQCCIYKNKKRLEFTLSAM